MLDNKTSLQEVFMWLGSEAVSFLRGWQKIELGSCDESDGEKKHGGTLYIDTTMHAEPASQLSSKGDNSIYHVSLCSLHRRGIPLPRPLRALCAVPGGTFGP